MKKILIPIGTLLLSNLISAQLTPLPNTENYIQSKTYLDYSGTTPTKSSETVQYFDGLGRPKQIIGVKASPLGRDVVTPIEYDQFGRHTKDYLPIPQSGTQNGAIVPNPLTNASSVYGSEKIYAEKVLENSPLDRIQQQIQVGNDWANKPVTFQYDTNAQYEVYKFTTNTSWANNATSSALVLEYFPPNQLYKTTVTDEDGSITKEYKNGKGQVIMVRKNDGSYNTDTYYVYNEYDQLAFVIPPKALAGPITDTVLNDLCYQYRYDGRGRLVEKKLPGKGWEYMVYDKQDRLVLTRDSNLEAKGQWLFTKYDQFSRPIYTGILDSPPGRIQQVAAIEGHGSNNEVRSTVSWNNSGMDVYYTNGSAYPTTNFKLLSVNYYDAYPQGYSFNPSFPSTIQGESVLTDTPTDGKSTKGLPVMSLVKNIEDDSWTKNYTYYDTKGRAVGSYSINHLGGYTKTESRLDFSGAAQTVVTKHKRLNTDIERVITENFTYDHQNRLLVHKHQVDNNPEEILSQNTYNELSQLSNKKVGGAVAAPTPLQSIDYTYNIRGWMTKINDPDNLNGRLFGYSMRYQDPAIPGTSAPQYGGNISEVHWKMANDDVYKAYHYVYDKLNRLTDAIYREAYTTAPNNYFFNENVTYDLNGNITHLTRNGKTPAGTTQLVDNLTYNYTGNRLNQVVENSLNDSGYEGGNNMIDYDLNGNMINMKDKGIQNIIYNYLNLPNNFSITQTDPFLGQTTNVSLEYLYRADGVKIRKNYVVQARRGFQGTTHTVDYLDGFQYSYFDGGSICLTCRTETAFEIEAYDTVSKGLPGLGDPPTWKLDFVPTSEGFYNFTENRYIYQYKDHLGNSRVSFAKNSEGVLEVTDTNNYYPFGLNHIGGNNNGQLGGYFNYKYNGKEIQETGMYDYGARMYMPDLGRWGVIDPLAEKSRRLSPYNYALNNPIRFIDPDGRSEQDWVKRTGQSSWEYHSDITSAEQASKAGYVAYADGRGDKNSTYTTPMSSNGIDTGVDREVILGEGGNYTVDGKAFIAKDQAPYVSSEEVDKLDKFLSAQAYIPGFIISGGTGSVVGDYFIGVGQRGLTDLSTQTYFKGGIENVDRKQLFINTFVGGGGSYQWQGILAGTNLLLNTANNVFGSGYDNRDNSINAVKVMTGALGNAAGVIGGGNILTGTILPSVYMNGTDKILNDANKKYKSGN